ncbi:MAG: type VII toxin-antitoxin system HepT family RNase toxin [Turicibacter sp.]
MKAQVLANIFNRDADLIDIKKSSTVFKVQIIGSGKVIYCNNHLTRANFEMKSLKEYPILNEQRGEILKNIEGGDRCMVKDVVFNKMSSIERCLKRINEVYGNNPENLEDFTKQDSIILNILRACECSIDLAMHIISEQKWGIPQNSRDAFEILENNDVIEKDLSNQMKAMVGFRNIAVHDDESENIKVVQVITEKHLVDFNRYTSAVRKFLFE